MKLLLPEETPLHPALPAGVEAIVYDAGLPIPEEHRDAEFLVTWGQPGSGRISELVDELPRLRWIQSLAAGPDLLLKAGFDESVVITSGLGLHDHTVAEHALALTLAGLARLDLMLDAQREHRWAKELGGIRPIRSRERLTTLLDARVTVWGLGGIGRRFAGHAARLGASVTGVARSSGTRDGFEVVTEEALPELLPRTDVLVLVLPSTPSTHHVLDASRLALLPQHAWVVNVGRGSTVDEDALVAALENRSIGGAALDVTETEPLPSTSPLWSARNVIISPHAAGGRPVGADELISHNLAAFLAGEPLRNVVDRG